MKGLTDRKSNIVSEDFPILRIPMKHSVVHYFTDPDFWMHGYSRYRETRFRNISEYATVWSNKGSSPNFSFNINRI